MKPPKPRLRPAPPPVPLPRLREIIGRPQPAGLLASQGPSPQGLLAEVDPALADLPPVGQMMNFPFASRWTEAPPPRSPGGQVAGSASPPTPPGPPPQPTVDQDALRKAIEQKLWEMMLGARVQPQPNQPAYSDQYATPSQPPGFAPPMGAYR